MKPFKTYRQQLVILRERGMIINDGSKAMRVMERENYYRLINGYKDLLLEVDENNAPLIPEKYKKGVTFEEIYKLYCFDRDLRNILLEYLLLFESSVKSKISYRFPEKYKEPHAYLVMKNYSRNPEMLKDVLNLIATISNVISKKGNNNTPIKHYLDVHEGVPLWVLVNYLTIGTINYFYKCLTPPLQNEIAKDFATAYNRDYSSQHIFTPEMLESILKTTNLFRNVCAHEERLYNFKIRKMPRSRNISSVLAIHTQSLNKGNLFTMVAFLKLVITKKEYKSLLRRFRHLFDDYEDDFSSVNFRDITKQMGFPSNWESLLL